MKSLSTVAVYVALSTVIYADDSQGKKVYECRYMEDAPYGVAAWSQSEMVASGTGKEARFVPYNSEAAQSLILDATTSRNIAANPAVQGHETSFYMVYNAKGWYIYIHCQEPDIQSFEDQGKDLSLEVFFAPGLERVPYYQMIVKQLAGQVQHYDWGMPHRHYRSLKDRVRVESLPLPNGVATFVFVPWEVLYDRLPFKGEYWRFSLMRWGPSVTWGGKVHDTGNFGLIHFQPPTAEQRSKAEMRLLRAARGKLRRTADAVTAYWGDEEVGDLEFYEQTLRPVVDQHLEASASLGAPESWNERTVDRGRAFLGPWMEFEYEVAELRRDYLLHKHFNAGQ